MTDKTPTTPPAPATPPVSTAPAAPASPAPPAASTTPDWKDWNAVLPAPVLAPGEAAPKLAPTSYGVYAFTIHLKSEIKRGYHLGTTYNLVQVDPPRAVADQIADMAGEWPFPSLAGVIGTPTMRPVAEPTIRLRPNEDTARACRLAPETDPLGERFILLGGKSSRELDAQLLE